MSVIYKVFYLTLLFIILNTLASISQITQSNSVVDGIYCPNFCIGETNYKLYLNLNNVSSITADRGIVNGDSIINIAPQNYRIVLSIKYIDGSSKLDTVSLPICDPLIPSEPLIASLVICESESIPKLTAISLTSEATVDWYDETRKILLASGTLTYQPTKAGTYCAQARIGTNSCKSGFSQASISQIRQLCIPLIAKKVYLK